ncbi:MAG: hypothetical protein QF752_05245, partial [Planctomycetota bacterium]|nr:hypothetical protein [Planctomycetota bacterium]
ALGGALLFLLWPSALFYYNQAVAEPITLTLVLGMLLSYRRQWTALTLVLAGLSLLSAYDSMLVVAGVFLDSLRYWKQADRRAWLARGFLFLGVVTAALALADWLILGGQFFPFYRVWIHVVTYYEQMGYRAFLWSKLGWTLLYFFAVFLVIPFLLGLVRSIRSWDCWIFFPVVSCLVYELYVVRIPDAQLGITLRHLTLIVPFCAYMTVEGFRGVSGLLTRSRPWIRWMALAGLCVGTLLVGAVQVRGHFYFSGVSGMASLRGLVEDSQVLPRYVHVSPQRVDEVVVTVPGEIDRSGELWQTIRVDLGQAFREAGFEESIDRIENWVLRGYASIRGMKLVSESGVEGTDIPIPTDEHWKIMDPRAGSLQVESDERGDKTLRVEPSADGGYFCAAHLGLDESVRISHLTQAILILEVRRESRFILQMSVRTETGRRRFIAVHSSLPLNLGEPGRVEMECRGLMIPLLNQRHFGFYRPGDLFSLAPWVCEDGVWGRTFGGDQKRAFDPEGKIRFEETVEKGLSVQGAYLTPEDSEGGRYVLEARFPRTLKRLTLAAFMAHVWPGSKIVVELEQPGGAWKLLGTVSGVGKRSVWGIDLQEEIAGCRAVKIRFEIRGGFVGGGVLRRALPVGLKELSIAFRYQKVESTGASARGASEK